MANSRFVGKLEVIDGPSGQVPIGQSGLGSSTFETEVKSQRNFSCKSVSPDTRIEFKMRRIQMLFLLLCIAGAVREARACTCSTPVLSDRDGAASQFEAAKAVFEGEVVSVKDSKDVGESEFTFKIIQSFKGLKEPTLRVFSDFEHTSCASGIRAGDKLFVYAFEGKEGKLYITACGRTGSLEETGADLRFARGEPATPEDRNPAGEKWRLMDDPTLKERGATLSGEVRWPEQVALRQAYVTLWEVDELGRRLDSSVAVQMTDSDGSFEIRYLHPGTYMVSAMDVNWAPTLRYLGILGTVSLLEGTHLNHEVVVLHSDPLGTVNVRVDPPQIPREKLFVVLRDVELDEETPGSSPYHHASTTKVDSDGVARFKQMPYGRYTVWVGMDGEDISKPSWMHDDIEVTLGSTNPEVSVQMHRKTSN
jgi:hypothetical protein